MVLPAPGAWAAGPLVQRLAEDGERIAVGQFRQRKPDFTRVTHEHVEATLYRGQTLGARQVLAFVSRHYTLSIRPRV